MKSIFVAASALLAVLATGLQAQATELKFTWSNAGGVFDTFDLNTAAGQADTVSGYLFFTITNDSAGGNGVYFGDSANSGGVGTGLSSGPEVTSIQFADTFSPAIYSGTGLSIPFTAGETFTGNSTVLTLSAVPEPAVWSLMLIGFGGLGCAARLSRRRVATAAV